MKGRAITIIITTLVVTYLILSASLMRQVYAEQNENSYKVRVDYILATLTTKQLLLKAGESKEIKAPPPPSGYDFEHMEVSCAPHFPPDVVPLIYDKEVEDLDKLSSIISYNGTVKLSNAGSKNITMNLSIYVVYSKRVWMDVKNSTIKVVVSKPEAPFTLDNLAIKVTIENFLPLRVKDVKDPAGRSLLSAQFQEEADPDTISIDPKHVQIKFSENMEEGTYTIEFEEDPSYSMPCSFIVAEGGFENDTVGVGATKLLSLSPVEGWELLGYVVLVYSVAPDSSVEPSEVYLEAPLFDYVYFGEDLIEVKAISYLVPPIRINFWVKGYIVFGKWFKVINTSHKYVNVIYAPIMIKEAGTWSEEGVKIRVDRSDLEFATYAYLVVQTPAYGTIADVKTPSGTSLGAYVNTKHAWGTSVRSVSTLKDEAYVQVKSSKSGEYGLYVIKVEWEPIKFKVIDSKGRAIPGAEVKLEGPISLSGITNNTGYVEMTVYHPGIYNITVLFKGYVVHESAIIPYEGELKTLPCAVYDLNVAVKGFWGQPLSKSQVIVKTADGSFMDSNNTNSVGSVAFVQLPKGEYEVVVSYKRMEKRYNVILDDNKQIEVKLDVVVEIPYIGIPLSLAETVGIAMVTVGFLALVKFLSRRYEEEVLEE